MSATYDSQASGVTASVSETNIASFNITVGGGVTNGSIAVGLGFSDHTVSGISVTINGNAASLISGTDSVGTSSFRSVVFGAAIGAVTGAVPIVVSWTTACCAAAIANSFSGTDQTTPFNNGVFNVFAQGPGGGTGSLTITSVSGDLTVEFNTNNAGVPTSPTQTSRGSTVSNFLLPMNNSTGSGTGTDTHTWTYGAFANGTLSGCNVQQISAPSGNPAFAYAQQ